MTTRFHIYKMEDNNRLKLVLDVEVFGKQFVLERTLNVKLLPQLKIYGFSVVSNKLIFQYGEHTDSKMLTLPWRTPVDVQVKFTGRDGRMITVAEDDVLRDGGLADKVLVENIFQSMTLTNVRKQNVELRYIPFELTTAFGTSAMSWLRKIQGKKTLDCVVIQQVVDGEVVDEGYHIIKHNLKETLDWYIVKTGLFTHTTP